MTEKACSRCGEVKPLDDFYRLGAGHHAYCKACGRAARRASYAKNPAPSKRLGKARAFNRLREAHPDEFATLYAEERTKGDVA